MAIIETGPETEPMITIAKEEYDDLREAAVKYDLLLDALFGKACLKYCGKELHFDSIDEIMPVLFPNTCAKVYTRLKEEERARLRPEEQDDA